MADELFMHFSHLISPNQHGFFKKRSTVTNLMAYTDKIQQCLEDGGQVDVIYTDFSKAFDKVNHQLILDKLVEWVAQFYNGLEATSQTGLNE